MAVREGNHPIQIPQVFWGQQGQISKNVTEAAYEVYCEIFRPQPALMMGNCRGGFGVGELIAFLYARSFPRAEWRARADEAFKTMENMGAAYERKPQ